MKVSVITVCWNSGGTIAAVMESVLAQRGVEVEYIVVDGGSQDGTVEKIREYEAKFGGRMRMGGKSTRGWKSNWRFKREIVRGNRENGYWCTMPMLAPKYAFQYQASGRKGQI